MHDKFVWNAAFLSSWPLLFAGTKDQQDQGIEAKPANHGGKDRAAEVIVPQLADLKSLGDLASGLAEPEPGVEQLNQTRLKSDEKNPGLHWGQHIKVWLLKHCHRIVAIIGGSWVGDIATWRGTTTSLTSLKQTKNQKFKKNYYAQEKLTIHKKLRQAFNQRSTNKRKRLFTWTPPKSAKVLDKGATDGVRAGTAGTSGSGTSP